MVVLLAHQPVAGVALARHLVGAVTLQQQQRQVTITYDIVPTVGAGVVLQQPWVHALPVKAVSTGDNPQLLGREGRYTA